AEQKKVDDEIAALVLQSGEAIRKVQEAGAQGPEIEDVKTKVQQTSSSYLTEPNKTYISSLTRLKDLLKMITMLDLELARNYASMKRDLESANSVNQSKLAVETNSHKKTSEDLKKEQDDHVQKRDELLTKVDQYQTENQQLATQVASLTTKLRQTE